MKKIRFGLIGSLVGGLALSLFLGCGPSTGGAPTDDASVGGSGGGGTGGAKTGGTGGTATGGTGGTATGGTGGTATGGTGGNRDAAATGGTGGNRDAAATGDTGGAGDGGGSGGTGGTPAGGLVVVAAGDIGSCRTDHRTAAVAKVVQLINPGLVLAMGDIAYPDGTAQEFMDCYHNQGWGAFKSITRPAPGNHDYHTAGASAYFDYFGAQAGPAGRGYYSFDQGDWHFISLNGETKIDAGSDQHKWLVADLAANKKDCILFYEHRCRFASNTKHGSHLASAAIFAEAYKAGAEIALGGHDHYYERFAPQDPSGNADNAHGIRQFVVGTGGVGFYPDYSKLPNSEVISVDSSGVLKLTLGAGKYSWEFVPVPGHTLKDSGSGTCHGKPAP